MRRLTLVAILGFGILLLFGCGERQASITGVVTDSESGNPLRDAIVTLEEHTAKTGADGHYHLDEVPPGSYTLTARMEGYKSYDRQIDAQGNQEVILDITLSPLEEPTPLPIAEEGQGPHCVIERVSSAISPDEGGNIVITEAESIYSNGFTLSIPPGAVEEEMVITVGDVTDDFPPIPNGLRPVGLPVSLQPHGLTFQRAVTVKIPYSDEMLAWVGITSPEDLLLKTYDLSTNEWTDVPMVQVDKQNSVIIAEIDHFSLFSLFSWWNRKETENPATDEQILTYINDSWGVVAAVDELARWNANTGIPFKDEIGGILTVMAMTEQVQNEEYRKAAITGGEWLAWQALKAAGYGWLRPFALLVEATYKGGVWFVKELDEGAFNAQICAYLYYRQEGYSVKEIKDLFVTDDGWVLTAMGTGCPPGYPRLTGRFKPEDVFRIGSAIWDAKQAGSYKQRDTESIRDAFIDAIRPVEPNQSPQVRITSPSESAILTAGDVVNLKGTAADAEDGTLTGSSLTWRIEIDGTPRFLGEGETLSLSELSVGTHRISLTAEDSQGQTAEDSIEITVQVAVNMPPEVTIATPSDGTVFSEGDSILFTGSAIDPEDGPLGDRSLIWVSGIDGILGPGRTVTRDDLSSGTHAITLSATDSHSVFSTKTITITIEPRTANKSPLDWRTPTIDELHRASIWGQEESGWCYGFDAYGGIGSQDWVLCEEGPYKAGGCSRESYVWLFVGTPLARAAMEGVDSHIGEDEMTSQWLQDLRQLVNNELAIVLLFEGTLMNIVPASQYQPMITQGGLVLRPFEASLSLESPGGYEFIVLRCRFKVEDLAPGEAFWFSVSQTFGELRFRFKIDPTVLGPEGFF